MFWICVIFVVFMLFIIWIACVYFCLTVWCAFVLSVYDGCFDLLGFVGCLLYSLVFVIEFWCFAELPWVWWICWMGFDFSFLLFRVCVWYWHGGYTMRFACGDYLCFWILYVFVVVVFDVVFGVSLESFCFCYWFIC